MPQQHAAVEPDPEGVHARPTIPVSDRKLLRLLTIGFTLIIALLGMDGFIGFRAILSIRKNVATLTAVQFRNVASIDEVQRAQLSLSSVLYGLPGNSGQQNRREFGIVYLTNHAFNFILEAWKPIYFNLTSKILRKQGNTSKQSAGLTVQSARIAV